MKSSVRTTVEPARGLRGAFHLLMGAALVLGLGATAPTPTPRTPTPKPKETPKPKAARVINVTPLPPPQLRGKLSLEETLAQRRTIRNIASEDLSLGEVGQLLWAAQGITESVRGLRTAPSAGHTYPIELFVVTRRGYGRYDPHSHSIEWYALDDVRGNLCTAAAKQECVREAPVVLVVASVPARTTAKFRDRAGRYVYLEGGHVTQNILLQATALGLVGVPIGAFLEEPVNHVLGLPRDYYPLYVVPVGHPRAGELEAARQGLE